MPELFGIEKSKELVSTVLSVVNEAVEAGSDGWQFLDLLKLAAQTGNINNAIKSFPQVKQEFGDWSAAETKEFQAFFVQKFSLTNEKLEAFIEHVIDYSIRSIDHVNEGVELVAEFKALKKPVTPSVTPSL